MSSMYGKMYANFVAVTINLKTGDVNDRICPICNLHIEIAFTHDNDIINMLKSSNEGDAF